MTPIKYKNHCDYAFLVWMASFPESFHPYDMQRFYTFAKCVIRYRSKKWLDYTYLQKRILECSPEFDKDSISLYWNKLNEIYTFSSAPLLPSENIRSDADYRFYQRGVIRNRIYEVRISEEEYLRGGASKKTMKNVKFL